MAPRADNEGSRKCGTLNFIVCVQVTLLMKGPSRSTGSGGSEQFGKSFANMQEVIKMK